MNLLRSIAVSLIVILAVSPIQGCDSGASSTEVRRDPEFEKAAMNAKYAMMEHSKPKKAKQDDKNKTKRAANR